MKEVVLEARIVTVLVRGGSGPHTVWDKDRDGKETEGMGSPQAQAPLAPFRPGVVLDAFGLGIEASATSGKRKGKEMQQRVRHSRGRRSIW